MSAIDEKIKKLREQEKQLELEKRKVEFLNHILQSAKDYNHKAFVDVKNDVILMLIEFTEKAIQAIETGTTPVIAVPKDAAVFQPETPATAPAQAQAKPKPTEGEMGPGEKLNFALDNRHLGGKKVTVANDKNLTVTGTVVGLDAPFVIVKTDTGPTIRVPLPQVSLA